MLSGGAASLKPLQYHLLLNFKVGCNMKQYIQDNLARSPRSTGPSLLHISLSLLHISLTVPASFSLLIRPLANPVERGIRLQICSWSGSCGTRVDKHDLSL